MPVEQQKRVGPSVHGHLAADGDQFLCAAQFGRIDSIAADIARHPGADLCASGPFMWNAILDTRVLIAEDLGAASTPLVLAQMEC
jgi:hypothetical protein